ncbi:MAG: hypothetical protein LBU34_07580 [Planctomycetaceae bacterium]|nr:hypothetical protein [Planctomycetaceae bacterium]
MTSNHTSKIHKVGGVSPKRRNVGAKDFSPLPHIQKSADADNEFMSYWLF